MIDPELKDSSEVLYTYPRLMERTHLHAAQFEGYNDTYVAEMDGRKLRSLRIATSRWVVARVAVIWLN